MHEVLRFQPLYQDRVWGGRWLEGHFGRDLPAGRKIGESWEIVDRPEAQSVVSTGALAGLTLRQVIERHHAWVMGPRWTPSRPFPILVKWLDCRERLSLQVHPPASVSLQLGGEPKTENWYVAATEPGAALLVGLRPGVGRAEFERALAAGSAESLIVRREVHPGDSVLVRSGTVHAIDAGNLILEIQQNSDTTYRVYDWGRVGLDGKPRALHIAQSLESILWSEPAPPIVGASAGSGEIAASPEFRISRKRLRAGDTLDYRGGEQPRLLGVVEGGLDAGVSGGPLAAGENVLVPFAASVSLRAEVDSVVLVTEAFA